MLLLMEIKSPYCSSQVADCCKTNTIIEHMHDAEHYTVIKQILFIVYSIMLLLCC